jgi:hypothetical protein
LEIPAEGERTIVGAVLSEHSAQMSSAILFACVRLAMQPLGRGALHSPGWRALKASEALLGHTRGIWVLGAGVDAERALRE